LKETPCFLAFDAALLEPHSKEISFIREVAIPRIARRSKAYFQRNKVSNAEKVVLAVPENGL